MTHPPDAAPPDPAASPQSHLFLLRVWAAPDASDSPAWAGKLQHVVTGEAHRFDTWPDLISLLQTMLPAAESATPGPDQAR